MVRIYYPIPMVTSLVRLSLNSTTRGRRTASQTDGAMILAERTPEHQSMAPLSSVVADRSLITRNSHMNMTQRGEITVEAGAEGRGQRAGRSQCQSFMAVSV